MKSNLEMRGLDIRVKFALAKIAINVLGAHEGEELSPIQLDAERLGHSDYQDGYNAPPFLFEDEPELINPWREGWVFKSDLDSGDWGAP